MKISPYDRYQGLMHSELYRRDYQEYVRDRGDQDDWTVKDNKLHNFQFKLTEPGKKFCKKWRLRFPLMPDLEYDEDFVLAIVDAPITYLDHPKQWEKTRGMGWNNDKDETMLTQINGKLVLMVDPSYSRGELEQTFKYFLKEWVKPTSERKRDSRDSVVEDIWEIYGRKVVGEWIYGEFYK